MSVLDYRPYGTDGSGCAKLDRRPASGTICPVASNPEQMRPAMSVQVLEREFPNDHLPLLRWLMFTGVCVFGFVLIWYYGLFRLMLASDKTYISSIIVILYAATCIHCFVRTVAISRESDRAHRVLSLVSAGGPNLRVSGNDV